VNDAPVNAPEPEEAAESEAEGPFASAAKGKETQAASAGLEFEAPAASAERAAGVPIASPKSDPAAMTSPDVTFPIRNGGKVSSRSGMRKDPFTGEIAYHRGVDIAAPAGTPVYPLKGGKVTYSGWARGYGNVVVVDHGDGFMTKYAHNRANRVAAGDRICPDTIIAEVGETGRSTGPHLHFEVLFEGKILRPEAVLAEARISHQGS
jgi:murein DD-endopeptidase MepM/ murein hydrolase activator NlpD